MKRPAFWFDLFVGSLTVATVALLGYVAWMVATTDAARGHEPLPADNNSEAHWLMVYTLGWANTFAKYRSYRDCDRAAEIAFGFSCTAKGRPDTIPHCACIPWPEAVAGEQPNDVFTVTPSPLPLNPPAPNTQNLPSPLQ